MYIITDSPNRAEQLFSRELRWNNRYNDKIINNDYHQLVSQLLKDPSFTEIKTGLGWHSLIYTKHSVFSQFDSLNNFVKIGLEIPDGILCHADSGQNFHGQKNRTWEAKEGNIHLSVLLKPKISLEKMNSKFLTMGVTSVIKSIDSLPGLKGKSMIKWPNDIYIEDSKIGGIITRCFTKKNMMRAIVLGIGLNVKTVPKISGNRFTPKAGCLKDYSESVDIKTVFHSLLDSLYTQYQLVINNQIQKSHKMYMERSLLIGKNIAVYMEDKNKPDFIGKVIGLGEDLELIFENNIPPIRSGRIEILVS